MLDSFVPVTFVGNHDVTRIASRVGPDGAKLAAVVLFTVGGTPHVYYGDELGFTGVKEDRVGGDDSVRPEYPSSPAALPPKAMGMFGFYKRLGQWRAANLWLSRAKTQVTELSNHHLTYRTSAGGDAVDVTLDLASPDGPALSAVGTGLDLQI
jgi:glycosidase